MMIISYYAKKNDGTLVAIWRIFDPNITKNRKGGFLTFQNDGLLTYTSISTYHLGEYIMNMCKDNKIWVFNTIFSKLPQKLDKHT